jgi:hypothetical protein
MKLHWIRATKLAHKGWVTPFYVVGDLEDALSKLLSDGTLDPISRADFLIKEDDDLHFDPGGMLKLEEPLRFTVEGVSCSIRPHKLPWTIEKIQQAEERFPGWLRIAQGPSCGWLTYFPVSFREPLLCALMGLEFEPGVKESRDQAQAAQDGAFLSGHLARPAPGGGFHVMRPADEDELPPEDLGFDVPEGIEPF